MEGRLIMRAFTDNEIYERLKLVTNYVAKRNHNNPLIVGIQSKQDLYDQFDDKFFLYDKNDKFIASGTGTTNAGSTGLKEFMKWNPKGTGVWKTNEFYPNCYKEGLHNGRMKALRLSTAIKHYRDSDRDEKAEEGGALFEANTNANFHTITYEKLEGNKKVLDRIGAWGTMCNVMNRVQEYKVFIDFVYANGGVADYAILKEWDKN